MTENRKPHLFEKMAFYEKELRDEKTENRFKEYMAWIINPLSQKYKGNPHNRQWTIIPGELDSTLITAFQNQGKPSLFLGLEYKFRKDKGRFLYKRRLAKDNKSVLVFSSVTPQIFDDMNKVNASLVYSTLGDNKLEIKGAFLEENAIDIGKLILKTDNAIDKAIDELV